MAEASGISASSVRRIWRSHGLQPHRFRRFKLSNDPHRAALELTQAELAEEAGVPLIQVVRYERGRDRVRRSCHRAAAGSGGSGSGVRRR
jgi:hypothetical protein